MLEFSLISRFLTSYGREAPLVIRWDVLVLLRHRSARYLNTFSNLLLALRRESIDKFLERCEKFKLSTAEKLNIINLRPSNQPEIYAIVEECGKRLVKGAIDEVPELLQVVNEVLPQPPPKPEEAAEQ